MEQRLFILGIRIGIEMKTLILGAGLSGISTAYFLQQQENVEEIVLLEKESRPGGLCRSVQKNGYIYDIGPHILFSKDKEILDLMTGLLDEKNDLKRSNQILFKGCKIQYPFENDLSKLPKEERDYCISGFNHNPYEGYLSENMLQFFLTTFGEGITNTYLRPYNEKIWKFDPSFMNTSMVERIPKPTAEEIQRSAAGETLDGYVHQLYFSYPSTGGIEAVPRAFLKQLDEAKCQVKVNSQVIKIKKKSGSFCVYTEDGAEYKADQVISAVPIQTLAESYVHMPEEMKQRAAALKYNSIAVALVKTPYDLCGDHFAFMIPDKHIIFHRISKMDFLGAAYHKNNEAAYMVEITYRKSDRVDIMDENIFRERIMQGVVEIGFARKKEDVEIVDLSKYEYAYVIYDLNHKWNMEQLRGYFAQEGLILNGRFGNFEYWNMDRVVRESYELVKNLTKQKE